MKNPRHARSGATLLVTLGVMTVLSVMVVTYLLTMRHQRLAARHFSDKSRARQALDVALARAMQFADGAMLGSNYLDTAALGLDPAAERARRVSPVNGWYRRTYQPDPDTPVTDEVDFQTPEALLVPVLEPEDAGGAFPTNALTVDLLTEEVRRLLPAALTNRLAAAERLRSGWITDLGAGTRVAFAVLDCSGLLDAHTFDFDARVPRAATQSYARAYYTQQDLVGDRGQDPDAVEDLTVLSYDPGPHARPLLDHGPSVHARLGYRDFAVTNKFNVNAVTNFFDPPQEPLYARVLASQRFQQEWLRAVSNELRHAQDNGQAEVLLGDVGKVAWNLAAYLSPSRVPQVSFPGVALGSRADHGIEAVPLVNEVAVFNVVDAGGNAEDVFSEALGELENRLMQQFTAEGYTVEPVTQFSNVYAAAAELWYPFVPRPLDDLERPADFRLYLGIYTNRGDVSTTTNSNWNSGDLADYYDLNDPSVAELEAYIWNDLYENDPESVTNTPLWLAVSSNALVVSVIQAPETLTETNLLDYSTAVAGGMISVYVDPETGLVVTNNPYLDLLVEYAPAPTNLPPEEVTNYYATADNYVPVLTTVLTSRVEDVTSYDGGRFSDLSENMIQRYLPPTKLEVGPFGHMFSVDLHDAAFDRRGFGGVTNNRDLVCFPVLKKREDTQEDLYEVHFLPLGAPNCRTWVRPLVAVREPGGRGREEDDGFEAVDEALLTREAAGEGAETIGVLEWPHGPDFGAESDIPGLWSVSVADPRDNAWAEAAWYAAPPTPGALNLRPASAAEEGGESAAEEDASGSGASDAVPGVAELPWVHADAPMRSIGELGYVTIDLAAKDHNRQRHPLGVARDTVDFATRAGAAALDRLCVAPTNPPLRGLVQANTHYDSVVAKLLDRAPLGWTNRLDDTPHGFELRAGDSAHTALVETWTNTLLRAYDGAWNHARDSLPGWRCFAEMLPDLATNAQRHASAPLQTFETDPFFRHDYVEDVMRGLVDKVSFRQNVYLVVLVAQSLSPLSSDERAVVLADQRAAVTVLRDAFTGRWLVYNWMWLTE